MMKNKIILIGLFGLFAVSCTDFLQPEEDNLRTEDQILSVPQFAEGTLLKAYMLMPDGDDMDLAIASDNAVSNDPSSAITSMAIGSWSANNDPISVWEKSYDAIFYCNMFLTQVDKVEWSWESKQQDDLFKQKLKAEAYGLRAYHQFRLLQFHAGIGVNDQLLGFPIMDKVLTSNDNWSIARSSYADAYAQIISDCERALAGLPDEWVKYKNVSALEVMYPDATIEEDVDEDGNDVFNVVDTSSAIVAQYTKKQADDIATNFNNTLGEHNVNRMNGIAVRALLSRASLYAASPAYTGSGVSWADAATIAGDLIEEYGYVGGVASADLKFWTNKSSKDLIWWNCPVQGKVLEEDNFPPSLFGSGRTNPTQQLVDAFPMADGTPISAAGSGYDTANIFAGRDPRLTSYILYNGNVLKGSTIYTYEGAEKDGINQLASSTRSGYYLLKLMNDKVNLTPGNTAIAERFYTYFRKTEVLLNFAEAANNAWGPTGDPNGYGFTAQSVINALRARAGIINPGTYVNTLDEAGLAELIKNERRIELCFEGHRFWDIRRWAASPSISDPSVQTMMADVSGMKITTSDEGATFSYALIPSLEQRRYQPYMIYGPIPYSETVKYEIVQNKNW